MNKKTLIIIDTNKLTKFESESVGCEDFSKLSINEDLEKIIFEKYTSSDFFFAIPEMVFSELSSGQKRTFEDKVKILKNQFKKFENLPDFELKIKEDYIAEIDQYIKDFIEKYNIIKLNNPDEIAINDIINKSLEKKAPFGKKGKGDAGLKDEIIWQSILKHISENKYKNYILLTKDKDFSHLSLLEEFKAKSGEELKTIKDIGELKSTLEDIQKNNTELSDVFLKISLKSQEIINMLCKLPTYKINEGKWFIIDDWVRFEVLDIDKQCDNEFQATLYFEIITYYEEIDEYEQQTYIAPEMSGAKIIVDIKDNKIVKVLSGEVKFYQNSEIDLFPSRQVFLN